MKILQWCSVLVCDNQHKQKLHLYLGVGLTKGIEMQEELPAS